MHYHLLEMSRKSGGGYFLYCVYDHESEANYGRLFISCVYDSLRLWKIALSTKFIAARKLNNNQPRILPANYLLGQGRETRYKIKTHTRETQPVDAKLGRLVKILISQEFEDWLEFEKNLDSISERE